jgi:predicted deacylase
MALVLSAPDIATKAVTAVHADLAARGRVRWSIEDVPAAAEQPYVTLAAFQLAPLFEQQGNAAEVVQANRQLAQIIALPTSGERVQVEYF